MSLSNETLLFCGHKYSIKNLEFAKMLEPENESIQHKLEMCKTVQVKDEFTVGNSISDERHVNSFVRCFGVIEKQERVNNRLQVKKNQNAFSRNLVHLSINIEL